MIYIRLMGGLGNQMFQYAFGKSLAIKNSTSLILDLSFFKNEATKFTKRDYALGAFNITAETKYLKNPNRLNRFFYSFFYRIKFYIEKNLTFSPQFLDAEKQSYFIGYFQSEKYFEEIRGILIKDFKLIHPSNDFLSIQKEISYQNAISIHFRRGDYASNQHINAVHGLTPLEYYKSAINIISNRVNTPVFYVFSDDIEWVKKHFPSTNSHYVSSANLTSQEEIILMSNCKHNIIANSSFSWWGAWLNQNPEKIVIAPRNWFNDPSLNSQDIVPKDWIRL